MRSLTCDDLEFPAVKTAPFTPPVLARPMPLPSEDPIVQVPEEGLGTQESPPKCAPWLLSEMILMGLDSYFPQLSAATSLWTPLWAAIPVLHWIVSWWIFSPGWEPNLVSLAPLSHRLMSQRLDRDRTEARKLAEVFKFKKNLGS
ncbi:hypothetical protein DSO57_1027150 [Entomophthora muscae]|uniref:Uncharacterized protein n=1 Tax=Entomophthora muscae TaxID=34485 RepID=A0ACC2S3Q8_9FUNG|nr:hypothetical protein DSO57_1027150 [Entomophthora muscae]